MEKKEADNKIYVLIARNRDQTVKLTFYIKNNWQHMSELYEQVNEGLYMCFQHFQTVQKDSRTAVQIFVLLELQNENYVQ